jgi:hypothetical protein
MARAIPCPCCGPKMSVRRISKSSVPCSSSSRSLVSWVDISPKYEYVRVRCQPGRAPYRRGAAGSSSPRRATENVDYFRIPSDPATNRREMSASQDLRKGCRPPARSTTRISARPSGRRAWRGGRGCNRLAGLLARAIRKPRKKSKDRLHGCQRAN